jgi:hypothetical protein
MAVASVVAAPAERCPRVNPAPLAVAVLGPSYCGRPLLGGSFPGLGSVVQKFGLAAVREPRVRR